MSEDLAAKLADIAEKADLEDDGDDTAWAKPRRRSREPSMVYSVRIPVTRVEELRQVAAAADTDPSALVRRWVLDRLDAERTIAAPADRESDAITQALLAAIPSSADVGEWSVILAPRGSLRILALPLLSGWEHDTPDPGTRAKKAPQKVAKTVKRGAAAVKAAPVGTPAKKAAPPGKSVTRKRY